MSAKSGGSRRLTRPSQTRRSSALDRASRPKNSVAWQQALLPVVVVALVIAASLVAHAKVHRVSEPSGETAVSLTRTLSCVRDARSTSTRIGTVPANPQGVTTSGSRVTFAPTSAADGYAVQWVSGKTRKATWLAARACPTLGDDWWFVGAGSSVQHDSILTLDNPEPVDATFAITVYGPAGPVVVPGAFPPVPAGTSRSFDLAKYVAASTKQFPDPDLTIHVTVTRGLVAASMWETWARTPLYAPSRQWVPAASAPVKRVQLMTVPGTVAPGTTLMVTNPGSNNAVVQVKAVNADATFAPTNFNVLNVPPGTTLSVPFGNIRKLGINSLLLSSSSRISAALRSVNGSTEAYAVPAVRIGAESTVGLPTGIPATLNLTAPTSATVTVQAVDARGNTVLTKTIQVAGGKATTLAMPKTAAALRLTSDRRSAAMAAIFVNKAGIAMIGMVPTANTARVPAVIPLPY